MRKIVVTLLLVGLGLAACTDARPGAPAATPAPAPAGAGTDQEVTVNRILAGLDGVMGDLQRILARERRITGEVTDRLQAIYTGPELLNQIDAFRADLSGGLARYKPEPGNRVTTVSRLITASPICVFAEVTRDYSPVTGGPLAPARLYVVLVDKAEAEDPRHLNPTPWAMLYDGVQQDGSQPADVCR